MNKHFPKRLLAGWLCLLMLLSAFPAAFLATAEGEEAATSGYKVLQAMADDQTLPYTAASNWYRFRNTNLMLNQEVQAKFAAGEDNDLALYLNLYIDNKSNPGNLGTLTTTKPGNDRRIVLQSFDGKAYYEVVWFYPQMALKAGWNKLLLAFSTTKCEAAGAKLAQKNTITAAQTAARQTFDINFAPKQSLITHSRLPPVCFHNQLLVPAVGTLHFWCSLFKLRFYLLRSIYRYLL